MAGYPGDPFYYTYETKWFCNNFFENNFSNKDLFYPSGVNMASGYHMPLLLTMSCPFLSKGPFFLFNFYLLS